jgi:4-hydroxybenzoate polyprenyltransferase
MNRNQLALFDYFFVLRPILFYPGWSTMLAGYFIGYKTRFFAPMLSGSEIDYMLLGILMASYGMLMGSVFVLNQLRDVKSDQHNKKLFFIANGMIPVRNALLEVIVLAVGSIAIGFYLNQALGFLYILFFILTGIFYNYAPFSLKDRPWGSLISNALMGAMAFAIGWVAVHPWGMPLIRDLFPYLMFNTSLYLFTTFPDIEGDRAAGKKTLAVIYGHERIILVSFWLYFFGALATVFMKDMQAMVFYGLTTPFFIRTLWTRQIDDSIRTTKFGIFFFALSICLKWPGYLAVMIIGFFGTRLYFRKRFNLEYPNFRGR